MSNRERSRPAWAKVNILLNLWDVPGATAAATAAMRTSPLPPGTGVCDAMVTGCVDMPVGWCFFHPVRRLAVINLDVYRRHSGRAVLHTFARRTKRMTAPRFVRYDAQSWDMHEELLRDGTPGLESLLDGSI